MQEIKSCPVKYFPYLESKMPYSVTYSAWKYSCFKLYCHKRKNIQTSKITDTKTKIPTSHYLAFAFHFHNTH